MLIIGIEAHALTVAEREFLQHPAVAGVILFSRNFASKAQLSDLCAEIRAGSPRPQLICVDQEGGRVQRFREGFAKLPSLERFGELARADTASALALAREHAFLMASEIIASGLDLSFAPVADLGRGNLAIGNRAFAADPATVAMFIESYVAGMHDAGMAATLKHFPGHGSVLEDTHFNQAVDSRPYAEIAEIDLPPFTAGMRAGADAVMMAHVVYPQVAPDPAGYSPHWIGTVLKSELGFNGVVFSDDIGMAAAESAGGVATRIGQHLAAGCDAVLACPPACVGEAVAAMPVRDYPLSRLQPLFAARPMTWDTLAGNDRYRSALRTMNQLEQA
ncbi:beta-N-acetylhexosaminidase [Arenimonas sp. GDDSR-1]|uniref:beta-N-acetylhexosaminidase n=1 Tax=Arenimonas sp. GDDSR-1 TaxID=2950125 RepID=UPI00262FEC12|nr:beta-N-acetylhexosaminidase [Arenimonas sp. GDDSR-1]